MADFKILEDFKILAFQNPEFNIMADFSTLAIDNPELKNSGRFQNFSFPKSWIHDFS